MPLTADLIIENLKKEFPDKAIFCLPQDNPAEIICETDPVINHPDYSEVIVYIKKSVPHQHLQTIEKYIVLEGRLTLYLNGTPIILNSGDEYEIHPNTIHWVEGDWVKIKTVSHPGWTSADHIIVPKSVSSGGIVIKTINNIKYIVLVKLSENIYTFPKGGIEKDENYEQAALREVHEETGLSDLTIKYSLGVVTRPSIGNVNGIQIKDIYLFMMNTDNYHEDTKDEETKWFSLSEAPNFMFPQEAIFLKKLIIDGKI